MLKIWGRTNSLNVQKAMWTVGELAIPHERIDAGGKFGSDSSCFWSFFNNYDSSRLLHGLADCFIIKRG